MVMHALSDETVNLITSGQIIKNVFSVVKELVENSLDAGSTSVEVKLESYGLDKIEVRDNGIGVKSEDIPLMVANHYTSKLEKYEDLERVRTYGFRGEALYSLCTLANVQIVSRPADSPVGEWFVFDKEGAVLRQRSQATTPGTTVTASKIFERYPVRREALKKQVSARKADLRQVESFLMAMALIRPRVRFTMVHNKQVIFQRPVCSDVVSGIKLALGKNFVENMEPLELELGDVKVNMLVPKRKFLGNHLMSRPGTERTFVFVNNRLLDHQRIWKILRRIFNDRGRHPIALVRISVPEKDVDVNLEPNKQNVFFNQDEAVQREIEGKLQAYYRPSDQNKDQPDSSKENFEPNLKQISTIIIPDKSGLETENQTEDRNNKKPENEKKAESHTFENKSKLNQTVITHFLEKEEAQERPEKIADIEPEERSEHKKVLPEKANNSSGAGSDPLLSGFFSKTISDKIRRKVIHPASIVPEKTSRSSEEGKPKNDWSLGRAVTDPSSHASVSPVNLLVKRPPNQKLIEEEEGPRKKIKLEKSFKVLRSVKEVAFDFQKMKSQRKDQLNKTTHDGENEILVGMLKGEPGNGFWVLKSSKELGIFNHNRIKEVMFYRNLCKSQTLPSSKLLSPVNLEGYLSSSSNERLRDTLEKYTDVLANNGFLFSPERNFMTHSCANLIPSINFDDCLEILEMLEKKNDDLSLEESRPEKIRQYFKGEAARMTRQCPIGVTEPRVIEKLFRLSRDVDSCLHSRPILTKLFEIR